MEGARVAERESERAMKARAESDEGAIAAE